MPMELCEEGCTKHQYDFPHRVIIPKRNAKEGEPVLSRALIICIECEHWVDAEHYECRCEYQCHFEAKERRM